MGYKRYERYKDSGVEWIGEIPEHWNITKIKYICSESAVYGLNETADNYEDDGVRLIRTTDIDEFGNLDDKINGVFISEEKTKGYILKTGDILLSRSGSLGLSLYFDEEKYGKCSYASYLVKFRTNRFNCPRYLFYFTKSDSFYHQIQTALVSSTISNFNGQKYANIELPLLNYFEQTAIASFLDQKTAEIDSLIADKEKMIQLLQEKRQAIITEAVTKGLNPNVPMKDSGVEWIGEISKRWNIIKCKRLFSIVNGSTPQSNIEDYWDGDIVWVTPVDLSSNANPYIKDSLRKITQEGLMNCSAKIVPEGSLILSTRAPIGYVKIAAKKLCTNQGCKVLVPLKKLNEKYFYYHIIGINSYIKSLGQGTTFTELSNEALGNILFASPCLKEQTAIANFLDQKTAEIDSLISDIQAQIAKLKEYRQSLIYEAVTGKIDVRDFTSNTQGVVTSA